MMNYKIGLGTATNPMAPRPIGTTAMLDPDQRRTPFGADPRFYVVQRRIIRPQVEAVNPETGEVEKEKKKIYQLQLKHGKPPPNNKNKMKKKSLQ